jgi:hypothetical protein
VRSECLYRETETGEQAFTADWPPHDVEIANLIDKLDHHRPLTGYHERIVKRVDHDRLIVIHEFTQPCISIAPIFNHVHLSPIAQNRMRLHDRERFGHHDMRGGSLKTTGQRKSLPIIPRRDRRKHARRLRGHQPGDRVVYPAKFEGADALEVFTLGKTLCVC